MLTENPAVAQSAFGPHRVVPDRWKGMSPEQLAEIRRVQEMQKKEQEVSLILAQYTYNFVYVKVVPSNTWKEGRNSLNLSLL